MAHWTSANDESFINRITFDFIAQLEHQLEVSGTKQSELASHLNVSDGAVSQVLNFNRMNLNLKTMVRYARALGLKVAIVAYDDSDPGNKRGPVGAEIFARCWERAGKPRNLLSLDKNLQTAVTDRPAVGVSINFFPVGLMEFVSSTMESVNSTFRSSSTISASIGSQLLTPVNVRDLQKGETTPHAGI
jgi:transcriptional regulator with XRE-family HTH domain